MSTVQHFKHLSRRIGLVLIAILLCGTGCSTRSSPERYTFRWAVVQELGRTSPLNSATFTQSGIVWDAARLNAPLAFSPLDQISSPQPLLDYPGIRPRLWQTAPAQYDTYHVIWLDQDHGLYSALIDAKGQTQRGPIELTPTARSFITLSYGGDHVFTAWINNHQLFAADIDQAGRPRPLMGPLLEDVSFIAATGNSQYHLAWLESTSAGSWAVNYQPITPDNAIVESFSTLLTFQLASDESITSFVMGLDQTHGYLFWTVTNADQPDVERVYTLSFPLDQPADVSFTELTLPAQFEPDDQLPPSEFVLGSVAALPDDSGARAALRWPRPATGQHALLPLAITLRSGQKWYPAVVYYQSGKALGYQIVASLPANAGPPSLDVDSRGRLHLAWAGLQGAVPTLFVASTAGRGLIWEKAAD
jgi:hypothetical protein